MLRCDDVKERTKNRPDSRGGSERRSRMINYSLGTALLPRRKTKGTKEAKRGNRNFHVRQSSRRGVRDVKIFFSPPPEIPSPSSRTTSSPTSTSTSALRTTSPSTTLIIGRNIGQHARRRERRKGFPGNRRTNEALNAPDIGDLVGSGKGDRSPLPSCTRGATNAVDVVGRIIREVKVDNDLNACDIDATCGNIRRDEDAVSAGFESLERFPPLCE